MPSKVAPVWASRSRNRNGRDAIGTACAARGGAHSNPAARNRKRLLVIPPIIPPILGNRSRAEKPTGPVIRHERLHPANRRNSGVGSCVVKPQTPALRRRRVTAASPGQRRNHNGDFTAQ